MTIKLNRCYWQSLAATSDDPFVFDTDLPQGADPSYANAVDGQYNYIAENGASEWEVGTGTFSSDTGTLTRDNVILSSTRTWVDFSAPPTVRMGVLLVSDLTLIVGSAGAEPDGDGEDVNIQAGDSGSAGGQGGDVNITSGASAGDGINSGTINIQGAHSVGGDGGAINIIGGNGLGGGPVSVVTGSGSEDNGADFTFTAGSGPNRGGGYYVNAGDATGSGTGGNIENIAGAGSGDDAAGGHFKVTGGHGGPGAGGDVELTSGRGAVAGHVRLTASQANDGDGGNVVLTPGAGANGGSNGNVIVNALPTADPHVANALWSNAGVLTISAG